MEEKQTNDEAAELIFIGSNKAETIKLVREFLKIDENSKIGLVIMSNDEYQRNLQRYEDGLITDVIEFEKKELYEQARYRNSQVAYNIGKMVGFGEYFKVEKFLREANLTRGFKAGSLNKENAQQILEVLCEYKFAYKNPEYDNSYKITIHPSEIITASVEYAISHFNKAKYHVDNAMKFLVLPEEFIQFKEIIDGYSNSFVSMLKEYEKRFPSLSEEAGVNEDVSPQTIDKDNDLNK